MKIDLTKLSANDLNTIDRAAKYVAKEWAAVSANVHLSDSGFNVVVDENGLVGEA